MVFLEDFNLIESCDIFEEMEKGEKKHYLRGIFSRVDAPNKNKRIYSRSVMEESINDVKPMIESRGLVGQLDHPPSPKIDVEKISHIITKLAITDDNAVIGEAEALDTEPGKHLKTLMESKVRLGVSTRGIGQVEPYNGPLGEGFVTVKPGYKMKAIDIVFDPSADSYPDYVKEEEEHKVILGATAKFTKVWEEIFATKIGE